MQFPSDNNGVTRADQVNTLPTMDLGGKKVAAPKLSFIKPQETISDLKVESSEIKFTATVINPKEASQKEVVTLSKQILVSSSDSDSAPVDKKNNKEIKIKVSTLYAKFQSSNGDNDIKSLKGEKPVEVKVKDLSGTNFTDFADIFKKSKDGYVVTIQDDKLIYNKGKKAKGENDFFHNSNGIAMKESLFKKHPDFFNYQHIHSDKLSEKDKNKINQMLQNQTVYVVSDEQFEQLVEIHNTKIDIKQAKLDKTEKEGSKETEVLDFHATPRKLDSTKDKEKPKENQIFDKHFPVGGDLYINIRTKNEKANEEKHNEEARELKMESMRRAVQKQESSIQAGRDRVEHDYLKQEAQTAPPAA